MTESYVKPSSLISSDLDGDSATQTALTTPVRLVGSIKWFDVAKGFGFIVPDGGGPDVLLHVTCLQRDGFRVAYEGARLDFEAVAGRRGWQVLRILAMDLSTAIHPAQMPPARPHSCECHARWWLCPRAGEVVQPAARLWFRFRRRGQAGYFPPYGSLAALRLGRC